MSRESERIKAFVPLGAPSYLRALARIWGSPRVSQLQFRWNPRLTTTFARLLPSDRVIEFNLSVARVDAEARRELMCHEAAHYAVWEIYYRSARPHGPEWAALVKLAGFEPKASRVRCGQTKQRPADNQIFNHICPVCHFSKRSRRRIFRWRCPECRAIGQDGSLRIERGSR
jgi:predicted SprT family Zn-dependent metalloprotease